MSKLSVVIITQNMENIIRDCLESVKWVDEIIIVDSFSSDKTVEISREYTDKIFQRKYLYAAEQKNFAILQATKEWILLLDADERVSEELSKEIQELLKNAPPFSGYYIPRKFIFYGRWIKHGGFYSDKQLRLFKNDRNFYDDKKVHAQLKIKGEIGNLSGALLHYSYENISDIILRIDKYSSRSSYDLFKKGKKATLAKIFIRAFFRFFLKYILRGGFRDGVPGFIISVTSSFSVFTKYAKLWERENAKEYTEKEYK